MGWTAQVYESVKASVVKVEVAEGLGAGFFFQRPDQVATALHVVQKTAGLRVVLLDGRSLEADVVAVDTPNDLAILRLRQPVAGVTPLVAASQRPGVGAPVIAIGHPFGIQQTDRFRGLLLWSATVGIVSAGTDRLIQTDASFNPGNSGGPVLDCEGRLVGVVHSVMVGANGLGFATNAERLAALAERVDPQARYQQGQWEWGLRAASALLQLGGGPRWYGLSAGIGLTWRDTWALQAHGGQLWAGRFAEQSVVRELSGLRSQEIVSLGRIFRPVRGLRVVPSLGVTLQLDMIEERRAELSVTGTDCSASRPCGVQVSESRSERDIVAVRPTAGLAVAYQQIGVSYSVLVPSRKTQETIHQLALGWMTF